MRDFIGIDYGSKTAGTTVITRVENQQFVFYQSKKKQDADAFLKTWITDAAPHQLFIDAPLSLPLVYQYPDQSDDYFYRKGDRELGAMSPMFIGGLTARAIRLSRQIQALLPESKILEVYPGALARKLELKAAGYKQRKEHLVPTMELLQPRLPYPAAPENWHQVDALLAWLCGWRYRRDQHDYHGDPREGGIIV